MSLDPAARSGLYPDFMRVISGKWKGHPLVSFSGPHIRPTTDRVKESLFNHIQFEVEGARVLDLFCGTGNLGIEALSRGSGSVVFVDLEPKSLEITRQNLTKLKAEKNLFQIVKMDVLHFLKNAKKDSRGPFDLILIDPPFTKAMAQDVMVELAQTDLLARGGKIAIESSGKEPMKDQYGDLVRYRVKAYGDKNLSWFARPEDSEEK